MPDGEDDSYSLARNRLIRVHVHHDDLRVCETACVALRIEGYQTSFSTERGELVAALKVEPSPSSLIVGDRLLADLHVVRRNRLGTPVIVVQESVSLDGALAALRNGFVDVIAKPLDIERMLSGLRSALNERIRPLGSPNRIGRFAGLTPREREVLELVLDGFTNKETGRILGMSPRTVEVHRSRIMEKTGAKNTADLVRKALA
jgi:FixJ family two-component response regulator